ncbi:MAG: hypothetical protein ACMUIP_09860 [bacterium]
MKNYFLKLLVATVVMLSFIIIVMGNASHAQDVVVEAISADVTVDSVILDADTAVRTESYFTAEKETTPWGTVVFKGEYGPDLGIGETGSIYYFSDPLTGTQISYKEEGLGVGQLGVLAGYTGKYSPLASSQYGVFAGDTDYSKLLSSTPGFSTYQQMGGNIMGSYQYSTERPDPLYLAAQQLSAYPQTQQLGQTLGALSLLGALGGGAYTSSYYPGSVYTQGALSSRYYPGSVYTQGALSTLGSLGGYSLTGTRPVSTSFYTGITQPSSYTYGYPAAAAVAQPSYTYAYPTLQSQYAYGGYGGVSRYPYSTNVTASPYDPYRLNAGTLAGTTTSPQTPPASQTASGQAAEGCIDIGGVTYCPQNTN